MKKLFAVLLVLSLLVSLPVVAYADEVTATKDQIINHMVLVNQQLGITLNVNEISALEDTIVLSAQEYCDVYNITKDEAYALILEELEEETPVSHTPATCETISVTLPTASTGHIFFIDSDSSWNHVGLYTSYNYIVEAMPEDGVRYWAYNASGAKQNIVTNPSDGVNDSCILNVSTTDANKSKAAAWPGNNVPSGTPYDYDFANNKQDIYLINVGTTDNPIYEEHLESDAYNCSELVWKAYKKAAGIDLDSNGGLAVYPNNILNSSYTVESQGNWW